LKNLRTLRLKGTGLKALPSAVVSIGLEKLDLAENDLVRLPAVLLDMPTLKALRIEGNARLVPEDVEALKAKNPQLKIAS
jgi:Leucine-rich repeat (LRR) protein